MGALIITGKNATGVDSPYRVGKGQTHLGVHAWFTGNMAALTIDIEGRILGTGAPEAWTQLGQVVFSAGELTAKSAYRFIADKPVDEVRGNITAYNGTGVVYCSVKDVP